MGMFSKWFDSLMDRAAIALVARLADTSDPNAQAAAVARSYHHGNQRELLRVKPQQFNDNIVLNLYGLVLDRIVSQMLGQGFELDFEGETETPQEQYIQAVLDANKQEALFHRCALAAGQAGTGYLYILPGTVEYRGALYPRLQMVDPAFVTMDTAPEDFDLVIRYTIRYKVTGLDGKELVRRRVIEHNGEAAWTVSDYETRTGGRELLVSSAVWPYPFAPILHWQNKPSIDSAYGAPDIDGAGLALQDRLNFTSANISKIVRLYAHPQRFTRGAGGQTKIEIGPDEYPNFPAGAGNEGSGIFQLDPVGDMSAALAYYADLRRTFFDTARVVDIDSMQDKLGALTNFALRVLYQDNLNLIATKRELFGDMLEELARRLLVLSGQKPVDCEVVWPEWLPENEVEKLTALEAQQRMGVVSKQTICGELGRDWEQEQERMAAEQKADQEAQGNVGEQMLRQFMNGNPEQMGAARAEQQQEAE